jgi:hypothetical protein
MPTCKELMHHAIDNGHDPHDVQVDFLAECSAHILMMHPDLNDVTVEKRADKALKVMTDFVNEGDCMMSEFVTLVYALNALCIHGHQSHARDQHIHGHKN